MSEHRPPTLGPIRAFWLALLCSVSVYFIPIIGPHATFFLWESLGQRFRDVGRNPAWAFTELGVALLLQAIALGLFYWFWRRRSASSLVVLVVCAVVALIEAQYERLLGDAIRGDAMLFVREEVVEAAWRVVDPVLGNKTPVPCIRTEYVGPGGSRSDHRGGRRIAQLQGSRTTRTCHDTTMTGLHSGLCTSRKDRKLSRRG